MSRRTATGTYPNNGLNILNDLNGLNGSGATQKGVRNGET